MQRTIAMILLVVSLLGAVGYGLFEYLKIPAASPTEVKPEFRQGDPKLVHAFLASDQKTAIEDARLFGALCQSIADGLEWDMQQSKPLVRNGVHLDDARIRSRFILLRGASFSATYPELADLVGTYLSGQAGTAGGPLSEDVLKKYINAYRALARASAFAAYQMENGTDD